MAQLVHKLALSEFHLGKPQLSYLGTTGHSVAGKTQAQQHKRPTTHKLAISLGSWEKDRKN